MEWAWKGLGGGRALVVRPRRRLHRERGRHQGPGGGLSRVRLGGRGMRGVAAYRRVAAPAGFDQDLAFRVVSVPPCGMRDLSSHVNE